MVYERLGFTSFCLVRLGSDGINSVSLQLCGFVKTTFQTPVMHESQTQSGLLFHSFLSQCFNPNKHSWNRGSGDSQRYYNMFIENSFFFFDSKVCQAQREKHKVVNSFCLEGKLWRNVTHDSW